MTEQQPRPIRLITLAPGHFHAALVQKQMLEGVSPKVFVYGNLDDDLIQHIQRIAGFNQREEMPTRWDVEVRATGDHFERFIREQPGNTVVLSGKNKPKIDLLLASVGQCLNVLADKPWVIEHEDFPILEEVFRLADLHEVIVWDIMTERFEVTNRLQRELMHEPEVFGTQLPGSIENPGLQFESVHYLKKQVAGETLRRPWWWFDVSQSGDAIADVGTHLADLAIWMLYPERAIDHRRHIQVLDSDRWPLPLNLRDFQAITQCKQWPTSLLPWVSGDVLRYFGNGSASVAIKGVHVRLNAIWDVEAARGEGDTHEGIARGSRSSIVVKHDRSLGSGPQLWVEPKDPNSFISVLKRLDRLAFKWSDHYPGLRIEEQAKRIVVHIPDKLRKGHEAHFSSVFAEYIRYFRSPRKIPDWERSNLLSKYYITTKAVEISRAKTGGCC